jgi:hypothetical protein
MKTRSPFPAAAHRFAHAVTLHAALMALACFLSHAVNAQYNPNPPSSPVRLVFIHHSVGEGWLSPWGGGLLDSLNLNNYYVHDTNYDWGPADQDVTDGANVGSHTDIGYWYNWFLGPHRTAYLNAVYANTILTPGLENSTGISDPGGENLIVMFKSCFVSVQVIGGQANDAPTPKGLYNALCGHGVLDDSLDERYSVANIKGLYRDLLDYFATRQDKLFILITSPPWRESEADDAMPKLRAINTWLVNDWLSSYQYKNVAVFDFSAVLTSNGGNTETNDLGRTTGSHHRYRNGQIEHLLGPAPFLAYAAYDSASASWDNHPTAAGSQKAASEFLPLLNIAYNRWKNTNPNLPPAPALLSPADNESDTPVNLRFTWSTVSGATGYHLQVSRSAAFTSVEFDRSGLSSPQDSVSGLSANTTYFWRVNASNAAGTGPWSPVRQFTTTQPSLAAPSLLSPADNTVNVPVDTTFTWNAVSGASSYRIQISSDVAFATMYFDEGEIGSTSFLVSGLETGTKYYWRVNASNGAGTSPYSAVWSFTTVMAAPLAPALDEPANDAVNVPRYVSLVWTPVADAYGYRVQLATDTAFSALILNEATVAAVSYFVGALAPGTRHYWRVNATNPGGTSPWSETWNFTTETGTAVDGDVYAPGDTRLFQNYPNPFTNSTTIAYRLATRGYVRLEIFDPLGRKAAMLVDEEKDAGGHVVQFESARLKATLRPGVYFIRLSAGGHSVIRSMVAVQ